MEVALFYDNLYVTTPLWSEYDELIAVGSLNGDLKMLVSVFGDERWPPCTSAIFLGDYLAPSGEYRYDALLFLIALKIRFPRYIVLLRGHGETYEMCMKTKFDCFCADRELFRAFMMFFDFLPLAAKAGSFLCVHSGVSPYMTSLKSLKTLPIPLGQSKISATQRSMVTDILYGTPDDTLLREFAPSNDYPIGFRFNKEGLEKVLTAFGVHRLIRTCHVSDRTKWCYDFGNDPICLSFVTGSNPDETDEEERDVMHYVDMPLISKYIIYLLPDGYISDWKVFHDEMPLERIKLVYELLLQYSFKPPYICRPLGRQSCLFCLGQLQYTSATVTISHAELADLIRQLNFNIQLDWQMDPRQLQYRLVDLSPALLGTLPRELKPFNYASTNLDQPLTTTDESEGEESDELSSYSAITLYPALESEDENLPRPSFRPRSHSFTQGFF
uniref:protein-serine/threonine phosphatase n=1 Tax=Setaria digitata TaxID=48799 RepID=A0A915PNC3_9BILA